MTRDVHPKPCPTEQLLPFHYAELDDAERRQVEQHLQLCPDCRTELDSLRGFLTQIPTTRPELSTAELQKFSARVMQKLPHRRLCGNPALSWALATAVVVMLTLGLWPQREAPVSAPAGIAAPIMAEQEVVEQLELLQNLELLENLDLLQQLASQG